MMEQIKILNNDKSQKETPMKLKRDNTLLENKLEWFQKEASKPLEVKIQVVEKWTNIDAIHIIAQEDANPAGEET